MRSSAHKVLITGGAKGIGLALARKFHGAGNDVTIVGRDRGALQSVSKELADVTTIQADITTPQGIDTVADGAAETSILVNNAGVQYTGEFRASTSEAIDLEVQTNLLAPLHLVRRFLHALLGHSEAAIVNVTSILAIVPKQSAPVYCATKAALRSFSRSLRWQLEGSSVRVFEVVPPVVDTDMTAGRGSGKMRPEAVADEVWRSYLANKPEILIGKARPAASIARLLPSLAERIIRQS